MDILLPDALFANLFLLLYHSSIAFIRQQSLERGSDGRLSWWDVQSGKLVQVHQAHQGTVQSLKVSPDGQTLASCGNDGAITLWNLHDGEYLRTLRRDRPYERLNITGIRGLSEAQKASLRALGAIEDAAVNIAQEAPYRSALNL